jgi:hypothetical protein
MRGGRSSQTRPRLGGLLIDEILKIAKGMPTRLAYTIRETASSFVEPLTGVRTRTATAEIRSKHQHVPVDGDPDTRWDHFLHAVTEFLSKSLGLHASTVAETTNPVGVAGPAKWEAIPVQRINSAGPPKPARFVLAPENEQSVKYHAYSRRSHQ